MVLVRQLKTALLGQFRSTNTSYTGSQRVKRKNDQFKLSFGQDKWYDSNSIKLGRKTMPPNVTRKMTHRFGLHHFLIC